MKKLRIKDVVLFKRKSKDAGKTFIRNLEAEKEERQGQDARNYWVRSESAVKNTFRYDNPRFITDKIDELTGLLSDPSHPSNTVKQYRHNLAILKRFEQFDFSILKPAAKLGMLSQSKEDRILNINGLPVEAAPSFVYAFTDCGKKQVGAVWFIARKDGFAADELGMFADMLHRYLTARFSAEHAIPSRYCIAVDLYKGTWLDYSRLERGEVPVILDAVLGKIRALA